IILGVGNNKFAPDNNCIRADFTIVLTKILGIDSIKASNNYDDVQATDYFYNYVGAARSQNIECGVTNNKFRPKDYITREEMMVMVYKGLVSVQGDSTNADVSVLSKFTDASQIAEENKAAVAALVSSGAISGTSATTLEPKAKITRAQMAVIMNKVDEMIN
ncbi:MAG: S-layer homology domain-containing protein, partial [Lachnospirales bacterium]